eukprot:scaffold43539_cov153-Amphora_coffeaeformis.AAC.1
MFPGFFASVEQQKTKRNHRATTFMISSSQRKMLCRRSCYCCRCCCGTNSSSRSACVGCCGGPTRLPCCAIFPQPYALITPRSRRGAKSAVQYILIAGVLVLLAVYIGAEVEGKRARQAPDTLFLYTTSRVCAATLYAEEEDIAVEPSILFETKESVQVATTENTADEVFIAHCGDCGKCSNPHDIKIYDDTRNTLFETAVKCAKKSFLFGRSVARECMDEYVGFTDGCRDCWVENILCDVRLCIFACLLHTIFSQVETGEDSQELNRCTECDEKRCGIDFVVCAGANRRRTGILSDIERDTELEVCQSVEEP